MVQWEDTIPFVPDRRPVDRPKSVSGHLKRRPSTSHLGEARQRLKGVARESWFQSPPLKFLVPGRRPTTCHTQQIRDSGQQDESRSSVYTRSTVWTFSVQRKLIRQLPWVCLIQGPLAAARLPLSTMRPRRLVGHRPAQRTGRLTYHHSKLHRPSVVTARHAARPFLIIRLLLLVSGELRYRVKARSTDTRGRALESHIRVDGRVD